MAIQMNKATGISPNDIRKLIDQIETFKDRILANVVMIGELEAPTYQEDKRIQFLKNRFVELGMDKISIDEKDNIVALIPGEKSDKNILLTAHVDTVFDSKTDHTINLTSNKMHGAGIADNSLGVAAIAILPELLRELDIKFDANVWLMGETRSLGKGDLEGLRFFLSNKDVKIDYGIGVEGAQLGRMSYRSVGMVRGEITATVPEEYDWQRMTYTNAIITLNEVINHMMDIPLPQRPKSSIVLGSIEGGNSYNTIATKASLKFEIRSESEEIVEQLVNHINDIVSEINSVSGIDVTIDLVATRKSGGLPFNHNMVKYAREIIELLDIEANTEPSMSSLAAFIDNHIPAVTVGLTKADYLRTTDESIEIEPIFKGIAQLIGLIQAIDKEK